MNKLVMMLGAMGTVVLLGMGGAAQAQETGLAGMHTWVRVGGKTCMLDHYHDGSGNGGSRAAAQASAIRAWADFTAFEYGSPWASWNRAVSKSANCSPAGGGGWSCQVSARPCRGR